MKKLFSALEKLSGFVNKVSDFVLAVFVIVIFGMIIIPVPVNLLDFFISLNLLAAFCLVFVAIYIQKAVQLSIFPSLLLVTTLYRLAITIAATKQILLTAKGGHVIETFAEFVIGGNYIVGFVIFLIITIVQFIVITKGAERVSEVAARFTLDAMPGKQMSIDADLRAGVIDMPKARQLRADLGKESQLYGAMDGAMKFVKEDVIAGIVITAICIIGGCLIGKFSLGMSFGDSLRRFAKLSIGEAIVAQVPALIISFTSGIITTRVSSDKKHSNLGADIGSQLFGEPKPLFLAAATIFGLGCVPGFPKYIFFPLAGLLCAIGFVARFASGKIAEDAKGGIAPVELDIEGHSIIASGAGDYSLTLPVVLEAGSVVSKALKEDRGGTSFLDKMIPKMRHALYQELGVRFPGVHVRTDSPNVDANKYIIHLHEVPIVTGEVVDEHILVNESKERLASLGIKDVVAPSKELKKSVWVPKKHLKKLKKAKVRCWTILEVVIMHISSFYKDHAAQFLGLQEVRTILEFVEKSYPDLVKEVNRLVPLQKLTDIFRRLVEEHISIKDLRTVMEALSEWGQTERDTVMLTEHIRSSLKRYISYRYSQGRSTLSVYMVDPAIEDMVRGSIRQTSAGSYLGLDADSVQMILQAVRNTVAPTPPGGQPPVLLTALEVRRFIRKLVESEFPDLPVLSYQEIIPEIKIQPLGRVKIS